MQLVSLKTNVGPTGPSLCSLNIIDVFKKRKGERGISVKQFWLQRSTVTFVLLVRGPIRLDAVLCHKDFIYSS